MHLQKGLLMCMKYLVEDTKRAEAKPGKALLQVKTVSHWRALRVSDKRRLGVTLMLLLVVLGSEQHVLVECAEACMSG